jgi:hypothetical protein
MAEEYILNEYQIKTFLTGGVLVVDNVLTEEELKRSVQGVSETLSRRGVATDDFNEVSGRALGNLSSTNGSGGVLDIFYEDWKIDISSNPRLFSITKQLWKAAYCHMGEAKEDLDDSDRFQWHPYGAFDCDKGYMYIDRIGYRLPTEVSEKVGGTVNSHKKKKARALQRSLTPHLDCCPNTLYENAAKWRPIQCFVSLTDNLEPNTGGFEAAQGFHRTFDEWTRTRAHATIVQKEGSTRDDISIPAPCVGEYTHIRPKEDREIMDRVCHVPVRAGSCVLWDNRIPHANAYRHYGNVPRVVVYCSFLPDVQLNREYVNNQLANWKARRPPADTWIHVEDENAGDSLESMKNYTFTNLGRKLIGLDPW